MNPHTESFQREYKKQLYHVALPVEIAQRYEVLDCLRDTPEKTTYLVRSKHDGQRYILKKASACEKESLASEFALLSALSHPCIPRAVAFLEEGCMQYLVREYASGISLDQLVLESGPLPKEEAVAIISQLCKVLHVLHSQQPPVIHRDIKPQNVLRTEQGCALIDFGIARRFDETAIDDTVYMGTRATAAPEQFGYMQTDPRSDVYSTGILLLFLLTGSCELKAIDEIPSRALRRIIRRCVRFDPANRYRSIQLLNRNLNRAMHQKSIFLVSAAFVLLLFTLGASLFLPMRSQKASITAATTDVPVDSPTPSAAPATAAEADEYRFDSPLIEQAVRKQLHRSASEKITISDLDQITGLYIFGDMIYDAWAEHSVSGTGDIVNGTQVSSVGSIDSLIDISHMKNIQELALYNQQITDLSPLKGLHLTKLGLGGNQITDISVLPKCGALTELHLHHNPVKDISPLSGISTLTSLELCQTKVKDIRPLSGLPLTYCSLIETPVADYSPLLELPHLQWLRVSDLTREQVAVIGRLTRCQDLTLYRCDVTSLQQIENLIDLRFLDLLGCHVSEIGEIGVFSHLGGLCLQGNPITDLTPIAALENLDYLSLINVPASDYSVLLQLPRLKTLDCDATQRDAIVAVLAGTDVQINTPD